jgi:hypothetical protein
MMLCSVVDGTNISEKSDAPVFKQDGGSTFLWNIHTYQATWHHIQDGSDIKTHTGY